MSEAVQSTEAVQAMAHVRSRAGRRGARAVVYEIGDARRAGAARGSRDDGWRPHTRRATAEAAPATGLVLNAAARRTEVDGVWVALTAREFRLAEVLARHPNEVVTRTELLRDVWDLTFDPGSNVVDVYIGYLRRKIGAHRIETVRGVGYRLRLAP